MQFTGKNGEFQIRHMVEKTQLNFPVANEEGIKSSVTQTFGGDCKLDQNHFLLEPVSIENLHNNRSTRNVWCTINRKEHVSLTGVSAQAEYAHFLGKEEEVTFDAGFMWQETKRELKEQKIEAAVRIFAPLGVPAELMQVRVTNKSDMDMCVRVTSAIPIYGRSADNLRDHRHVTSLLHRIRTTGRGVICKPVLSFDERGHQKNHTGAEHVHGFVAQDAGRHEIEHELALVVDDGVAGVVAALIAHDDVVLLAEQVDHAALALIAPVDTYDGCQHC